jgi:hypothetical protein
MTPTNTTIQTAQLILANVGIQSFTSQAWQRIWTFWAFGADSRFLVRAWHSPFWGYSGATFQDCSLILLHDWTAWLDKTNLCQMVNTVDYLWLCSLIDFKGPLWLFLCGSEFFSLCSTALIAYDLSSLWVRCVISLTSSHSVSQVFWGDNRYSSTWKGMWSVECWSLELHASSFYFNCSLIFRHLSIKCFLTTMWYDFGLFGLLVNYSTQLNKTGSPEHHESAKLYQYISVAAKGILTWIVNCKGQKFNLVCQLLQTANN